jgi:hypothetical protein
VSGGDFNSLPDQILWQEGSPQAIPYKPELI